LCGPWAPSICIGAVDLVCFSCTVSAKVGGVPGIKGGGMQAPDPACLSLSISVEGLKLPCLCLPCKCTSQPAPIPQPALTYTQQHAAVEPMHCLVPTFLRPQLRHTEVLAHPSCCPPAVHPLQNTQRIRLIAQTTGKPLSLCMQSGLCCPSLMPASSQAAIAAPVLTSAGPTAAPPVW
jgi:hypothetical protein